MSIQRIKTANKNKIVLVILLLVTKMNIRQGPLLHSQTYVIIYNGYCDFTNLIVAETLMDE